MKEMKYQVVEKENKISKIINSDIFLGELKTQMLEFKIPIIERTDVIHFCIFYLSEKPVNILNDFDKNQQEFSQKILKKVLKASYGKNYKPDFEIDEKSELSEKLGKLISSSTFTKFFYKIVKKAKIDIDEDDIKLEVFEKLKKSAIKNNKSFEDIRNMLYLTMKNTILNYIKSKEYKNSHKILSLDTISDLENEKYFLNESKIKSIFAGSERDEKLLNDKNKNNLDKKILKVQELYISADLTEEDMLILANYLSLTKQRRKLKKTLKLFISDKVKNIDIEMLIEIKQIVKKIKEKVDKR
jgi:hypothetical protein